MVVKQVSVAIQRVLNNCGVLITFLKQQVEQSGKAANGLKVFERAW